jgi:ankyrin repeat protein
MTADDDIFYGQSIFDSIESSDIERLRESLRIDDVNAVDHCDCSTYLMFAVRKSNIEIIRLLIEAGANMYAKNDLGDMAIHLAAKSGDISAVKVFYEQGCNLDVMGQSATPIGYALRFGQIQVATYLAKCGADIDIADEFGVTARDFAMTKGIQLK